MEITGKVHCLFEQSGTFKREFIKLGIPAEDYDIQDNFGETDHVIDLFAEIENAYRGGQSIFDSMTYEDLVMAFFPCIYFETIQQLYFCFGKYELRNKDIRIQVDQAIERLDKRTAFHKLLYKFYAVCHDKGIRLIIENPATEPNYLITGQNFPAPTMIDKNRMLRGDVFKKPTAYWFVNCTPTNGFTEQMDKQPKRIDRSKASPVAGLCSEERSMIHPDYARNFICDFILGKEQPGTQLQLFES